MKHPNSPHLAIDVDALRPGMFVQLDLGWLQHPFARNRFKLENAQQIARLRQLGVREVMVWPGLSDVQAFEPTTIAAFDELDIAHEASLHRSDATAAPEPAAPQLTRRAALLAQRASFQRSERAHAQATRQWLAVTRDAISQPRQAFAAAQTLAGNFVTEMQGDDDVTLRVLTETAGTAASQHAVNVTVLALMLARKLQLPAEQFQAVAVGALMHDIGKLMLTDPLRNVDPANSALVLRERHEHVSQGVRLGMSMGMDAQVLRVIAQHHELHDGSGLPRGLKGEEITLPARIVSLVNLYDRLCNPHPGQPARTPHEAQAWLFAQRRGQFDATVMTAFIKLMGVYPPGSMVELSDGRYALVVSVNGDHALKPSVLVHDPRVPREEALLLHLHLQAAPGIRRSVHAQHLPRATLDYLAPRERVLCYFAHGLQGASHDHAA